MSRKPCTFKISDLTRALVAAKKAGVDVRRIRIANDGSIEIDTGKCEDQTTIANPWDGLLSNAEDKERAS
jgi:hypothetical protein